MTPTAMFGDDMRQRAYLIGMQRQSLMKYHGQLYSFYFSPTAIMLMFPYFAGNIGHPCSLNKIRCSLACGLMDTAPLLPY